MTHWGARGLPVPAERNENARPSWPSELDRLPLETTALGTRTAGAAEIVVRRADGLRGARLRLADDVETTTREDGGVHLQCPLEDPDLGLAVTVHLRTSTHHDVVAKWAELRNCGDQPVELLRGWGGAFNAPVGPGARVGVLSGAWGHEFTPAEIDLGVGTVSVGSRQGITSHDFSPVVTLSSRAEPTNTYAVALAWSGSWRLAVDAPPFREHVRVAGGTDDESGIHRLEAGESMVTPAVLGLWCAGTDADDVAAAWHTYQRVIGRGTGPEHRPIVYNSWYATRFHVQVDHQLRLAREAARLGAEAFVVDDGWFRGRTSDRAGLGDWEPDPTKFPSGLEALVDGVRELGMTFGIWIEPEAVSPDSELYRRHPDWIHRAAGRAAITRRNQYTLDLGIPDVEQWVTEMLRRLLTDYDIGFLKWDMNRLIADGGQTQPGGDDWSWRHTQAYYRVLDMLRTEFPEVTVEACSGGGGRYDNAVLARSDLVWTSDETGPRDRLSIQHGFLSGYPAWTMSSWVTDEPDVRDTEPASLEFRFVVAMAGALGIGADLLAWDTDERERASAMVAIYRQIRSVVHTGRVRRHGTPAEEAYAIQYTTRDSVVVLAWRRPGAALRLRLADLDDLDENARYRAPDGGNVSAHDLAETGYPIGWTWGDCDIVVFHRHDRREQ